MPLRAELRIRIERVLRVVSLSALASLLWLSLDDRDPERVVTGESTQLRRSIRDWSAAGIAPDRIVVHLGSTPTPVNRDWLRALRGAGSDVTWTGDLAAVGISAIAAATPRGGWNVAAAAPPSMRVEVADEIGAIDTARASRGGARYFVPSAVRTMSARTRGSVASAALDDSVRVKRVLVLGSAGWESKFVVAALEEDGWKVDSDIRVAPGIAVTQGSLNAIDTSRYSAVVALDASATSRSAEIGRYAASGGGVIIAGRASALDAFASLKPGSTGKVVTPLVAASQPGSVNLSALAYAPITALRSDAIPLERVNGVITGAVRRAGAGRVLQETHLDTWRWRMSGDENAPADHREWWSRSVAAVAYAKHHRVPTAAVADNAPVARLVAALGPASSGTQASLSTAPRPISPWLLYVILALALLGEWASRRLRGAR